MGLFDKVLGSGTDKMDAAEGFAGIAFCAVAADGVLTQEEQLGLVQSLSRMKLYGGMSSRQMSNVFEKVVKVAREKGVEGTLVMAAGAVPNDLKPTAFAVAADLVMSDGHVAGAERQFLEKIQKALGVDDATAVKIVEVISIKNKG